jgi:2-polyprenyl-3-methyl-5-hydroxy-6-metoxy-1,4-benzoquinol methylase
MTTSVLACALCGGGVARSESASARLDLLECARCGHVVSREAVEPTIDAARLQLDHFGDAFAGAADRWTRTVDRLNARRVRRVLTPHLAPAARVLEIGPGRGAVLAALAAAGFRPLGLELSPAAARQAAALSGAPVSVGSLEQHGRERPETAYDAIVGRHVLEHMREPAAALRELRGLLRPGGLVYLAVPNIGALEAALPGWSGYQPYHLHYFRPATLEGLLRREGFAVLRCRTREPFSGWTNAVVNSLRPSGGTAAAGARGALRTAYNAARLVVGVATWPARLLQQWSGRGEEIEILARRAEP